MSVGDDLLSALENHHGVDIDRQRIEEWVKEYGDKLVQRLQQGEDKVTIWITSGNSMVVGFAMRSESHPDSVIFDMWVCKIVENTSVYTKVPLATSISKSDPNYCCCPLPKLKRVDISSTLGYDFCETCRKERK